VIPTWLPLRAELPGREALLARAHDALDRRGQLWLDGPPGVGKTAVVGSLLAGSTRSLVAVSLLGCEDAADAARALGSAAGVLPVGDEGGLHERLRARGPLDLLVDDVASEHALELVLRLHAHLTDARLIVVSEAALHDDRVEVPPLDETIIATLAPEHDAAALGGNAALARLVAALGLDVDAALGRLGDVGRLLASFPMGIAGFGGPLPAVATVPDPMDRVVLRRGLAARLTPLPFPEAAAALLPALRPLLSLADGAHPSNLPDPRDILLLRRFAAAAAPGDAARALAAAARLAAAAGQVPVARGLLAGALGAGGAPADVALLLWADGDALESAGELEEALARWSDASARLRRAKDPGRAAALHRRSADRLAARGEVSHAERLYRLARQLYRAEEDAAGVAATLRGAADLAVAAGEGVSAGTLQEQAVEALSPGAAAVRERANLQACEASLALSRGELGRASRLLDGLTAPAHDEPLLRANLARRRADLLLRRGDHEGASAAARQAASIYAALGEAPARGRCVRLQGDIAAAAGRPGEARARFAEAVRLQVRTQDLPGLARTLEHAAVLEESLGNADAARRLREQRAAVREVC
jgi:tetratricopeptide (TPR) repeat protein